MSGRQSQRLFLLVEEGTHANGGGGVNWNKCAVATKPVNSDPTAHLCRDQHKVTEDVMILPYMIRSRSKESEMI